MNNFNLHQNDYAFNLVAKLLVVSCVEVLLK